MIDQDAVQQLTLDLKEIFRRLHDLETNPFSVSGSAVPAPDAVGDTIIATAGPLWNILTTPGAAGYARVSTATTEAWDQTPAWTGDHTWDDGVGDSPAAVFVGGSNDDTVRLFLDDDGVAGNSDFVLRLPAADADSQFQIQSSAPATVAYIDAAGNADFSGHVAIGATASVNSTIVENIAETFTWGAGAGFEEYSGIWSNLTINTTAAGYTNKFAMGALVRVTLNPDHNVGAPAFSSAAFGLNAQVVVADGKGADVGELVGGRWLVDVEDASALSGTGLNMFTPFVDTGSCVTGRGLWINQGTVGAGSITTLYGMFISSINAGGTNWAIFTNDGPVRFGDDTHVVSGDLYIDTAATGIIHVDGVAAGMVLRADGTRYVPAVAAAFLPVPPNAVGDTIIATAGPLWDILATPGAAGYARVSTATTEAWDQTPTMTGSWTWDDGAGDSPSLVLVGGSNDDTISIFLDDDAVAGDSDLVIRLVDTSGDSGLIIQSGAPSDILSIFSDGDIVIRDNAAAALKLEDAGGLNYLAFDTSNAQPVVRWNAGSANVDYYIEANAAPNAFFLRGLDGRLGLNIAAPVAQLDIDQKDAGAVIPVLKLDQADVSEPCILYSVSGADADIVLWNLDVTDNPSLLWDESEDALTFSHALAVRATLFSAEGLYVPWIAGDSDTTAYFGSTNANNDQAAIEAYSDSATTIFAHSEDTHGIFGQNNAAGATVNGVWGNAQAGGRGVYGSSISGEGVTGASVTGIALRANLTGAGTAILQCEDNGTPVFFVGDGGPLVGINETANANMTIGLTIDQGPADNEIINFRSSDVGAVFVDVETGTYLITRKLSAGGGALLRTFKDATGINAGAFIVQAYLAEDTNVVKTIAARAIAEIYGYQTDGSALANTVADGNVFAIRTQRGDATVTTHWFDEDGDIGYGGALVAFDDLDDAAMARDLQLVLTGRRGVRYNQEAMVAAGILHPSEHGVMVSHKRMTALMLGTDAQAYDDRLKIWDTCWGAAEDRSEMRARIEYLEKRLEMMQ